MPTYVHRTVVDVLFSIASSDLPEAVANYIEEPNLTGLADVSTRTVIVPVKYWKVTGDVVSEMNASEKAVVDAAEDSANTTANRASTVAAVDISATTAGFTSFNPLETRELIHNPNQRINYLINRVEEILATLEDIRTGTGNVQALRDSIPPQHANQATQNPLTKPANFSLIQNRTLAQAVQAFKDEINAGDVD